MGGGDTAPPVACISVRCAARRTHVTLCFGVVAVSCECRQCLLRLKSDGGYRGARFQGEESKDGGFGTAGDVGDGRGDDDVGQDVVTGDAVLGYGQYRATPVVGIGA